MQTFSGRKPSQHPFEIKWFVDLLLKHGVTRYLEVGARHGDTFHYVMSALPKGSFGVALDLPGARWGKSDSQKALHKAVEDLAKQERTGVVMLADSQDRRTAESVEQWGPFDAVLIDGDHSLEGVTRDFQLYGDMAPILAFHDIVGDGIRDKASGHPVEVPILWRQLKARREHVELVASGSKMGIGVLCGSR